MNKHRILRSSFSHLWAACVIGFGAAVITPTQAFQFSTGAFTGSWDNTLSYGLAWRVDDRNPNLLAPASTTLPNGSSPPGSIPGQAFSVNGDDGNLNYDKGLFSNMLRLTSELEIEHRSGVGGFIRGLAFYDFENEDKDREKIDLADSALDLVGSDIRLLDAYVYGSFKAGNQPAQLRLGRQVLNWGESTFIQNGLNSINTIDVTQLRVPGAELRNALEPLGMLWGSIGVGENGTLEGFYEFEWDETDPEPSGSYFSTNDFATRGGNRVTLGFGFVPDITPFGPAGAAAVGATPVGVVVPRGPDQEAENGGQFGFAYSIFSPRLNNTEFGFYFVNYHSRLPIVSARSGTTAGLAAGDYAGSANYFVEYPEDIQMLGFSFNSEIGNSGWAINGEISHKLDAPLQVDDTELLFAALSPISAGLAGANQVRPGGVGFNTVIPGFIERDVTQAQATVSKLFPNVLRADQLAFIGELGVTHVHNMPSKNTLRLEAPGTYTSGNPALTAAGVQPFTEPLDSFADATSWGYRFRARLTYNNAIGPWALIPNLAFAHDFSGISPGPGGNFREGRKALSLALMANLRNQWTAELRYTDFFGAGRHNLLNDRDFISFNIKYAI